MLEEMRTRPAMFAGSWYAADPYELTRGIDRLLADAANLPPETIEPGLELVGVVAPHAGHRYSGRVAAAAFRLLRGGCWDSILLIGPSHRIPVDNAVLVADVAAYATPLGLVHVDRAAVEALAQRVPVQLLNDDIEHSLEIELPFLQRALAPLPPMLPLMVGYPNLSFARQLAEALAHVLHGRRTLLIASSDWSHYYPDAQARQLDRCGIKLFLNLDAEDFASALATGMTQACGAGALLIALLLARLWSADRALELAYATSGDVTGDRSRVVGYAAIAMLRRQVGREQGSEDADG